MELKQTVERSKQFVTEEGYNFSDLTIKTFDGQEEVVNLSDGKLKTLLLIFNTTCDYCVKQYPSWKEAIPNLDNDWRVLALTPEQDHETIKNHLHTHSLRNIKVGSVSQDDMRKARLGFTPMTLALGSNGEVKKVWPGLWKKGFELPN